MHKREGRTGDIIGRSGLEAFGDPFHESGLAGAEIAAQKDEQRAESILRRAFARNRSFLQRSGF